MDNKRERQLEERIRHLEIEVSREREWNDIPESLKPTSKGRWDQLTQKRKSQDSRRLGWPNNY